MLKENGVYASAKSIDEGQPAHFAQADLNRYFLVSVKFSACLRTCLSRDSLGC